MSRTEPGADPDRERESGADSRRTLVNRSAGALTGCYPPGYLAGLREAWPT